MNTIIVFLLDQLDDPGVSARAMFGGHGIYRDGAMFAIVFEDEIYMKTSDQEAAVSDREPFRPREGQTLWTYRLIEADELEDRGALANLASAAQRVALDKRGPAPLGR